MNYSNPALIKKLEEKYEVLDGIEQSWIAYLNNRLLIYFLNFLSSHPKRNRNYKDYGNWREFMFL